jgi:hypothetical protein
VTEPKWGMPFRDYLKYRTGTRGPAGPQGAPGAAGQDGAPGAAGQDGAPGAAGQDGAPGAAGHIRFQGDGVPDPDTPGLVTGDTYLDISTGDVYTFTAGGGIN